MPTLRSGGNKQSFDENPIREVIDSKKEKPDKPKLNEDVEIVGEQSFVREEIDSHASEKKVRGSYFCQDLTNLM